MALPSRVLEDYTEIVDSAEKGQSITMAFKSLSRHWKRIVQEVLNPRPDAALSDALADQARDSAPVLWMLGKVQSGKTAIIHAITRHPEAAIGAGFKPCTRHASQFEFPPELPMIRFIDTRGLGELDYHPEEDLQTLEQQADALVVVVRVLDPQQEQVLAQLQQIRRRQPEWPVVIVLTRLHDAYPDGRDHPDYANLYDDPELVGLQRALHSQQARFSDLPGKGRVQTVAVDFTRADDGFADPDYGLEALLTVLDNVLDDTQRQTLRTLTKARGNQRMAQLNPHLVGYAMAAGLTDMIPVAGLVTVPTLQGKMLHTVGRFHDQSWDRRTLKEFSASLGSGALLGIGASFGARQLGKLIPVYGQSVGALAAGSASAAVTYALGRAASYYLEQKALGREDPGGVAREYQGSLKEAWQMFHDRLKRVQTKETAPSESTAKHKEKGHP